MTIQVFCYGVGVFPRPDEMSQLNLDKRIINKVRGNN